MRDRLAQVDIRDQFYQGIGDSMTSSSRRGIGSSVGDWPDQDVSSAGSWGWQCRIFARDSQPLSCEGSPGSSLLLLFPSLEGSSRLWIG